MSTLRFSWKGVIAVVLCSIVVLTADRLFAQLNMEDFYRSAAPLPGPEMDWSNQAEVPSSSPYVIYDDTEWVKRMYPQGNGSEPSNATNTTTNFDVRDGVPQSSPILEQPAQQTRPYDPYDPALLEHDAVPPPYQTRPREYELPAPTEPACAPIVCSNGASFPTCIDGYPIDYWRNPCDTTDSMPPEYGLPPTEPANPLPGMPSQTFYGEGDTFLRQHTGFGKPSICAWMAAKPMEDEKKKNELLRGGCDPAKWMKGVSDNPWDMPPTPSAPPPEFQGMQPAETPYPAAPQQLPEDNGVTQEAAYQGEYQESSVPYTEVPGPEASTEENGEPYEGSAGFGDEDGVEYTSYTSSDGWIGSQTEPPGTTCGNSLPPYYGGLVVCPRRQGCPTGKSCYYIPGGSGFLWWRMIFRATIPPSCGCL